MIATADQFLAPYPLRQCPEWHRDVTPRDPAPAATRIPVRWLERGHIHNLRANPVSIHMPHQTLEP